MTWLFIGLLTLAAVLLLVRPLVGRLPALDERAAALAVYRDQLAELAREAARGEVGEAEARAARVEIERRILRLGEATKGDPSGGGTGGFGRAAALAGVVLAPLLALGLYAHLGSPQMRDLPFAAREDETPEEGAPDPRVMVASLEAKLRANPDDLEGWLRLARSKAVLGESEAGVKALRRAYDLAPNDPRVPGALGEAIVNLEDGVVTPEAKGLFEAAERLAPEDPRPAFYLAQADLQAGRSADALSKLERLVGRTPSDAPWLPQVETMLKAAATGAGEDPDEALAAARATAPDAVARELTALPPEAREARIKGMVASLADRLAREGGDGPAWARLAQAQTVIGDRDAAARSYAKARGLSPDDPRILKAEGVFRLGPPPREDAFPVVTDAALADFEAAKRLDPADPEPLWYLGIRAFQDGDRGRAAALWRDLLAKLPEDHPDRPAIEARLKDLGVGASG